MSIQQFYLSLHLLNIHVYTMEKIKVFFSWLRNAISPVYVSMVIAAFVLWFITKLGGTYTTDHEVTVVIDNVEYNVSCTIRGKGTDLVHYTLSSERSSFDIPISDLTQDKPMNDNNGNTVIHITAESMKLALAQRMSSIEVVSVGSVPVIVNERIEESAAESEEKTSDKHTEVKSVPAVVVEQPTEGEVVAVIPVEEQSEVGELSEVTE